MGGMAGSKRGNVSKRRDLDTSQMLPAPLIVNNCQFVVIREKSY